ncbi:site-2 protease family protein [Streptomyces sp. NPDC087300]|uniref:site-2 protease family protein n=1 Tax=Streptomyces sp. NPDC087300 TaxID=3365780 RepID=UPI00382E7B75
MDESGGSGRPQSDGAEDRRPGGTNGSAEPAHPVDTARPRHDEAVGPAPVPRDETPETGHATRTPNETQDTPETREPRETHEVQEVHETPEVQEDHEIREVREGHETHEVREGHETREAGDAREVREAPVRDRLTKAPPEPAKAAPDDSGPERAHATHGPAAGKGTPPTKARRGPGGGLLMGRPFGVPVYVAPSWFLVAALITWVFGGQLDRVLPELGGARYLVSLFFAVAFYASVLVHELAHTVAALRFKLPVRRIQLQFFGGVSEIEKESETPGREFVLAFVGPLLSLVLAGVFYAGMRAVEPGTVPGVLLAGLMISNLIVAAFNLLPGLPLDGGRMLRAVVWKITGKPMSGTVAAAWVGRALAVSVLIGLPLLNQSGALGGEPQDIGGMDTVTDALLAAILAAIIWTGAGNSLRMARLREHLPELRARTLTRRAVPVEGDTPLSEALRRANDAGARALVVVDPDGDPLSVVREAAIVSVPEHRRPWVTVSGLAQDITEGMRVSAELAGEELLDTLRATPATEYLVVEDSGEIFGVLSAADVERAFVKAMARPS